MKALLFVTGRGLGGDASIALNLIKALERHGIDCEIALDEKAPGTLFKKHNYTWHKVKIPQAGGHAATKVTAIKAAIKMFSATYTVRKLIKKVKPDFVVGVIGGGAIVGCFGAKISGVPAVTLSSTPLDYKVCTKLNHVFVVPELNIFRQKTLPNNVSRTYFPLPEDVDSGIRSKALEKLKKEPNFDENKKTILFSSGSTIFKGTIDALVDFSAQTDEYNLVLIGLPLEKEYLDLIDKDKIIYLGYINWIKDLYKAIDLAVITDDGIMMQEILACNLPSIALTKVKYGRYHNLESIFKGAIVESEVSEITSKINYVFDHYDAIKSSTNKYSQEILQAGDNLVENMLKQLKL